MQPETRVSLHDTYRAAQLIQRAVTDISRQDFLDQWEKQAAIERQFIIIGKAMVRIRNHEPCVLADVRQVREIIQFRNLLVHRYDGADHETIFELSHGPLDRLIEDITPLGAAN